MAFDVTYAGGVVVTMTNKSDADKVAKAINAGSVFQGAGKAGVEECDREGPKLEAPKKASRKPRVKADAEI